MKTPTEPESTESERQKPGSAARREESTPSDNDLDPDFSIAVEGGPTDSGGDPHAGPGPTPPPKG